jgi:uncharacterized phage-associated protein
VSLDLRLFYALGWTHEAGPAKLGAAEKAYRPLKEYAMLTLVETGRLDPKMAAVLARLIERLGPLYTTQAVKLPYFVDVIASHVLGRALTRATYEAWGYGVVAKEVYAFINYDDPGPLFTVTSHQRNGELLGLACDSPAETELTECELEIVDFVAEEYGRLHVDQLGKVTKRMNTEIAPEEWGDNAPVLPDEEAYLRLDPQWQGLCESIRRANLDDRSKWSEPIERDPLAYFRRVMNNA